MKTFRIKKINVVQTAIVLSVFYFFMTLVLIFPMFFVMGAFSYGEMMEMAGFSTLFFIAAPFLYAIVGFIISLIGALIYNMVAKWTGGIEMDLEAVENVPDADG